MAKFLKGQRNVDKLAYKGFVYGKGSKNITTQNWRCEWFKSEKCRGSASIAVNFQEGCIVRELATHNHPPDPARVELGVQATQMLQIAADTNDPPRRIVSDMMIGLSEEAQARAPKRKAVTQQIQRKRRRVEGYEQEPRHEAFQIPERFRTAVHSGQAVRFLLHDDFDEEGNEVDGEDGNRLIIFASDTMLDILREAETWMMDGTFKCSPNLFFQLYTIHGVLRGYTIPAVYALMPGKRIASYSRLFEILNNHAPELNPRTVIMDFERAPSTALLRVFPEARIQRCFFHLSQSVWRKTQEVGLSVQYTGQQEVRRVVKSVAALAFIPPTDVVAAFEEIEDEIEGMDEEIELRQLLDYFEDTYIGRRDRRGRRRSPLFPLETWSVHQAVLDGRHRTQNRIEGWHRALQSNFDGVHPSVFRFFRGLQREEGLQHSEVIKMRGGIEGPKTKKKYADVTTAVLRIVQHKTNLSP